VVRSSPLWPERESAPTTVAVDFGKHFFQVCFHLFVGEPQCADFKTTQYKVSVCIILLTAIVRWAIELNNKLFLMTIEIGNEEKVIAIYGLVD
jgi:hypothetical protein